MIKIGKKIIKNGGDPFIIAEAGVNHNGRLDLALQLVDMAKKASADAVKFETFMADQVTLDNVPMAEYQRKNTGRRGNQISMLKKLELDEKFYPAIIKRCKEKGIVFLSTPHGGFASVDLLQKFKVPAFKFGSGDLNNFPLLEYAAKLNKPMIVSTGMATMEEVAYAIRSIKKTGNNKIILLHCTSEYPCPSWSVNLQAMITMRNSFKTLVGYSDHTLGTLVPVMAATLGACVIEKHITLDKNMEGPDHRASVELDELKSLIEKARNISVIMGSGVKKPTPEEKKIKKIGRKSVVSISPIKKGEILTPLNIGIKRPGTGLQPIYYMKLMGKRSAKDIKENTLIKIGDVVKID